MNKLDLIKKLNKEIGNEPELDEPKTLRLLKEIVKLLKDNSTNNNIKLIRNNLINILDKINFKDYDNNFDELIYILLQIKNKKTEVDVLERLVNQFIEIISSLEYPTEIKVSNFPKQKDYPKKISINNFPEQKTKIEVINFPKEKDYPNEIKISNFPKEQKRIKVDIDKQIGIKKPIWYKQIILQPFISNIISAMDTISDKIFKVDISKHKKEKEALAVKLVDKDGKFIDKLIPPINISNPAGSGGGGRTTLYDKNENVIDDNNPLPVKAELEVSDIEIGAVEVKNGNSDTRLDVELDDTKNAIYVKSESLATEDKQDDLIAQTFPVGTGTNSTRTLTDANTAYSVPATAPTKNYVFVLYNGSDTDMYWGYQNSNANGILLPSGGRVNLDLGVSQLIYAYCASAGKVLTYTLKELT